MKKELATILFLLVSTFTFPALAQSIAWFNPQKVLRNSSAGRKVLAKQQALKKRFERERKNAEKPLAKEKDKIEKAYKNYQANQSVLNVKERKKRMAKLKGKYDSWMAKVKKIQAKLSQRQQQMAKEFQRVAEPFSKKLKRAAAKVAASKGYSFIIAHDPQNPQLLLYAKPSLDVTSKLISMLGN